jgi:hypothetical protein
LFLGGVTARFPGLHFAFLEGGVGWARTLLADLIGHWEKRGGDAIRSLDPARLDLDELVGLFARFGPVGDASTVRAFFDRPDPHPPQLDDFAAASIARVEDFVPRFVEPFFFGCEADDPVNAWAFRPPGPKLQAVLGSDIGHWDVPHLDDVLHEAFELVEEGVVSEADFREFVFANPVRLYGPRFFEGTSCEAAVRKEG